MINTGAGCCEVGCILISAALSNKFLSDIYFHVSVQNNTMYAVNLKSNYISVNFSVSWES